GSQVNGLRLVEVLAQVGDTVSAGQLLARFDDAPVLNDLAQARASLMEAQAQLTDAAANACGDTRCQMPSALRFK
ncbi:MAG: biotin/lipoyl-binding protein, partial [Acidimicrobiaceae bacterium]